MFEHSFAIPHYSAGSTGYIKSQDITTISACVGVIGVVKLPAVELYMICLYCTAGYLCKVHVFVTQ